jgi:hypothetical protein
MVGWQVGYNRWTCTEKRWEECILAVLISWQTYEYAWSTFSCSLAASIPLLTTLARHCFFGLGHFHICIHAYKTPVWLGGVNTLVFRLLNLLLRLGRGWWRVDFFWAVRRVDWVPSPTVGSPSLGDQYDVPR